MGIWISRSAPKVTKLQAAVRRLAELGVTVAPLRHKGHRYAWAAGFLAQHDGAPERSPYATAGNNSGYHRSWIAGYRAARARAEETRDGNQDTPADREGDRG